MPRVIVESLVGIPVVIGASNRDKVPFRPGSRFEFPVVLTHNGQDELDWSQQAALNLSYRWLTSKGEVIERDGRRTELPAGALVPGARIELDVVGVSPEDEGSYQLQVSLVLEGAHWACDMGTEGWTQLEALVAPAPAWPDVLSDSNGGRAIRGAMVAAELARSIAKRSIDGKLSLTPPAPAIDIDMDRSASAGTVIFPRQRGMRAWLLAAFGVRGLEKQLSDVIEIANRQEKQALSLEQQIVTLREDLLRASASPAARAAASKKQAALPALRTTKQISQ